MLNVGILKNIAIFMERVQCQGKEAMAWAETYQAVHAEIQRLSAPVVEKPE